MDTRGAPGIEYEFLCATVGLTIRGTGAATKLGGQFSRKKIKRRKKRLLSRGKFYDAFTRTALNVQLPRKLCLERAGDFDVFQRHIYA